MKALVRPPSPAPHAFGSVVKRALTVWVLLLAVAIANGWFREALLVPPLGRTWAHAVSSVTLSALILVATYSTIRWMAPQRAVDAARIGALWLLLTTAFEFGFGRLGGRSWGELLEDYDLARGRIWMLVLIVTAVAPALTASARRVYGGEGAP
jgi:hypothetical protein